MALIERIRKNTEATSWPGEIPMNYVYTAGRAGDDFFKALRDKGELLGSACERCNTVTVPARIFCEKCMGRTEGKYVKLSTTGTVHSFTVCHEDYKEQRKPEPSVVAFIKFDGAEGGLYHWIKAKPGQMCTGMRVEMILKPKKDREGGLMDIDHFKPV